MNSRERSLERVRNLEPGYYLHDDSIVKVVKSDKDTTYAMRLNARGFFNYEKGLIFKIFPNHKVREHVGP